MNIRDLLTQRVTTAMQAAGLPDECQAHIAPSKKAGFGDYQANGAMGAAKIAKAKPRDIAQRIVDHLEVDDLVSQVEIAGPGFINLTLKPEWLASEISAINQQKDLGVGVAQPQTIVVDYSSPNLAKEMHVGHLRSTIIGDAIVRALEFQGHKVIRQNHVGDWGTQFGMLIAELEEQLHHGETATLALKDLEGFYQSAKKHFDASEAFADKARDYVVKLQSGDKAILALWQQFRDVSLEHSQHIYNRLQVTLGRDDVYGESAYNDDLETLVDELNAQGLAVTDQGARVVFLEEITDKEGNPSPVIIQKQGGGFLYATTDLAALRYRSKTLKADRVLYFIDARQSLHMQQVFTLARKAQFIHPEISLEHHAFGTMMGPDGKPFKTRSGDTVKLADLLQEACERAEKVIIEKAAERQTEFSEEERKSIAQKVGIGAIKYADLSKTRTNDYMFNWETMLSFEGNTAPYLQYAFTRIQSIFAKSGIDVSTLNSPILLADDTELVLSIKTLQFTEVIQQMTRDAHPHLLCTYLYELAGLFMRFYERCPILKTEVDEATKTSRLQLATAVANTLGKGLELLGIETMERM